MNEYSQFSVGAYIHSVTQPNCVAIYILVSQQRATFCYSCHLLQGHEQEIASIFIAL